jgi:hypothetical protein
LLSNIKGWWTAGRLHGNAAESACWSLGSWLDSACKSSLNRPLLSLTYLWNGQANKPIRVSYHDTPNIMGKSYAIPWDYSLGGRFNKIFKSSETHFGQCYMSAWSSSEDYAMKSATPDRNV